MVGGGLLAAATGIVQAAVVFASVAVLTLLAVLRLLRLVRTPVTA